MNYSFLANTDLFRGIHIDELKPLLEILNAEEKSYAKGEIILNSKDSADTVLLVESGSACVVVNQFWGDSTVCSHISEGEIFDGVCCDGANDSMTCDVVATDRTTVLFFNSKKILEGESGACLKLLKNFVGVVLDKNRAMTTRLMHIASNSIRERVLSYFNTLASEADSTSIVVPFARQQLADYLSVNRSALSNELSKMQKDGLLEYAKNNFTLNYDKINAYYGSLKK